MQQYLDSVINGDCLEVMKQLPDNSVDMIFTDPPYGHRNHDGDFNARLNKYRNIENKPIANDDQNSMRRVVSGMLEQAARILKHDCCCCCCCCGGGGGPKPTFAWLANRMDGEGLSFFHSVIWNKINPGLGWRYRRQHEMIMVAHRTGGKLKWANEDYAIGNIISVSNVMNRVHPNEKPLDLVKKFIWLHTKPGDVVLDPFAGSCTTGVACAEMDRKYICIEMDKNYCDIGKRRIDECKIQTKLF